MVDPEKVDDCIAALMRGDSIKLSIGRGKTIAGDSMLGIKNPDRDLALLVVHKGKIVVACFVKLEGVSVNLAVSGSGPRDIYVNKIIGKKEKILIKIDDIIGYISNHCVTVDNYNNFTLKEKDTSTMRRYSVAPKNISDQERRELTRGIPSDVMEKVLSLTNDPFWINIFAQRIMEDKI